MKYIYIIFAVVFSLQVFAQDESYIYRINPYNFVRNDLNTLHNFGQDAASARFYEKLEKLLRTGEGQINMVHIGGSHVQAGTFTGQIRSRLQQMNGDLNAGWGYMFPYRISHTNSPFGYYIRYTGNWQSCRNVERRKTCPLGMGGISATTSGDARLTVLLEKENQSDFRFNRLRVYYQSDGDYQVSVDSVLVRNTIKNDEYYEFELNEQVDSLNIFISKNSTAGSFTLHGIVTESAPNGILYHSLGVNGASVPSFLRCNLLEQQLKTLKPDLVVLGLGINDAYVRRFSQRQFEDNYEELIRTIRRAAPQTAIILITNNDSYMVRRYVNRNGEKVEQSMFRLSEKLNTGVWDMFRVMGGLNSIVLWEKNNLAQHDKIHFTREGYLTLGDLFFTALMKNFEDYVQLKNQLTEYKN